MAVASPRAGVFISYRRRETGYPASWLYERLSDRFGREHVFKDVDSINPGDDFETSITESMRSCHTVLIGPTWLAEADPAGGRRIDAPHVFVRREIETALTCRIRVIPILIDGAVVPRPDQLPDSIRALAGKQAMRVGSSQAPI